MDSNTGGILGIFAFLTSGAGLIYAAVNHKRIRCRCCGRDLDMSVDVDPTDVPKDKKVILPDPSSADTAPVVEEKVDEEEEEEEDETHIQYVEPSKKKKSRVYPG
jgi:hypothetical protein